MKTIKQTQIGAIIQALLNGEKVSALTAFKEFGTLRLGAQIFRIEDKFDIVLNRKDIKGKTRYKTTFVVTEYWMNKSDIAKVKRILKESSKIKN